MLSEVQWLVNTMERLSDQFSTCSPDRVRTSVTATGREEPHTDTVCPGPASSTYHESQYSTC